MKKVIIFLSPTRCWLDVAYGHEIHNYILIRVACCDNTTLQSGITHNSQPLGQTHVNHNPCNQSVKHMFVLS